MKHCLVFIVTCSDNDDELSIAALCGFDNPIEELDWLRAQINRRN